MKKHLLLAALVCCTIAMNAQNPKGEFSIKPMAGINVTGLSGGAYSDLYHYKVRFTGGVEAEYGVNDWLGISLGAVYSQQGAKVEGGISAQSVKDGTTYISNFIMEGKLHCEYINIPLMANIYIPQVKGLAVKIGIQTGLLIGSKMEESYALVTYPDIDYEDNRLHTSDTDYTFGNLWLSDVCKSVDFGIPVGLSYEYRNVVLDARYYFGLTRIDKTENPEDCRNRYFSFTLGYRFHL